MYGQIIFAHINTDVAVAMPQPYRPFYAFLFVCTDAIDFVEYFVFHRVCIIAPCTLIPSGKIGSMGFGTGCHGSTHVRVNTS